MKKTIDLISSGSNPLLRKLRELRTDKTVREKERKIVVCGSKAVLDVAKLRQTETVVFSSPSGKHPDFLESLRPKQIFKTNHAFLEKISGLENVDQNGFGVVAEFAMPNVTNLSSLATVPKPFFGIVADRISDPGNLGSLVRSAAGFGLTHVCTTPSSVDFFNDKVVRSTMGSLFSIQLMHASNPLQIREFVQEHRLACFVAEKRERSLEPMSFEVSKIMKQFPNGFLIVLGSEAHGVSPELSLRENSKSPVATGTNFFPISLPMHGPIE